jgi:hypothetical protein
MSEGNSSSRLEIQEGRAINRVLSRIRPNVLEKT